MKASELRIKNWVELIRNGISQHFEVCGIVVADDGSPVLTLENESLYFSMSHQGDGILNPIPLNHERLEILGYSLQEKNTYIIKNKNFPEDNCAAIGRYSVCWTKHGYYIYSGCDNIEYEVAPISHVHTLQNWHHIISGEELSLTHCDKPAVPYDKLSYKKIQ